MLDTDMIRALVSEIATVDGCEASVRHVCSLVAAQVKSSLAAACIAGTLSPARAASEKQGADPPGGDGGGDKCCQCGTQETAMGVKASGAEDADGDAAMVDAEQLAQAPPSYESRSLFLFIDAFLCMLRSHAIAGVSSASDDAQKQLEAELGRVCVASGDGAPATLLSLYAAARAAAQPVCADK